MSLLSSIASRGAALTRRLASDSRRERELAAGLDAVFRSCIVAKKLQGNRENDPVLKQDKSPVTVADLSVQAIVSQVLLAEFGAFDGKSKGFAMVAEENLADSSTQHVLQAVAENLQEVFPSSGNAWTSYNILDTFEKSRLSNDKGRLSLPPSYWVLDPIDGTKGFLRGDQYAVALAFVEHGVPVLGILGCPNLWVESSSDEERGIIMFAVKGEGTKSVSLQAIQRGDARTVSLSSCSLQSKSTVKLAESFEAAHTDHSLSSRVVDTLSADFDKLPSLRIDSQVKYAALARGDANLLLRFPRAGYLECIWDHCAGTVVLEEAGGVVTHADGASLDYFNRAKFDNDTGIVAAGNPNLHAAAIKAIAKCRASVEGANA